MSETSTEIDSLHQSLAEAENDNQRMREMWKWLPIETAEKTEGRVIVALSPGWCDGTRPIVLTWYKYNGLWAWRDWDTEPHQPTHWLRLPPLPAAP